ncbi:MAG: hypothetical protein QM537_03640 [Candidatus Symbiobacter sp.]|nr:hypothetical protein [Candidatus Symbiobacter sp.]
MTKNQAESMAGKVENVSLIDLDDESGIHFSPNHGMKPLTKEDAHELAKRFAQDFRKDLNDLWN